MIETTAAERVYKFWRQIARNITFQNIQTCFQELWRGFGDFKLDVVYLDSFDLLAFPVAEKFNVRYIQGCALSLYYFELDIHLLDWAEMFIKYGLIEAARVFMCDCFF